MHATFYARQAGLMPIPTRRLLPAWPRSFHGAATLDISDNHLDYRLRVPQGSFKIE
jgi:hypothetical protein